MKVGELFGNKVESINLSEEDKKEYNEWLGKLQYTVNKLDLSTVLLGNKMSVENSFESVEIVLNALKEIALK